MVPAVLAWNATNDLAAWQALAKLPAGDWDRLATLHTWCGGPSDLSVLRGLIGKAALRKRVHGRDKAERESAVRELMTQALPQPHHVAYRQYLAKLQEGSEEILPLPAAGAFSGAVAARAFLRASQVGDHEAMIAAAGVMLDHPATLDNCVAEETGQVHLPDPFTGDILRHLAVKALKDHAEHVPEALREGPIWPAVLEVGGSEFIGETDGGSFRRAAQELAAQASAETAFHCLLWSAACCYADSGKTDVATLQAAVDLAQKSRWKELHQTLLVMAALRLENEKPSRAPEPG